MKFTIPNDPHEFAWLTKTAVDAHCSIEAHGRSTFGFGVWYQCTVSHLLAEMKHARNYEYGGKLLPLLGALSAIDQFGDCYNLANSTLPPDYQSKSGIVKASHDFLNILINTQDSDALYALRNGLMHQSSLISKGKNGSQKNYWFEIDNTIKNLFIHARSAWDGKFDTRSETNKTIVNPSKVLELAINLTSILKELLEQGKLQLRLAKGLEELLTTYVTLEFEDSFRDSYIKYLSFAIHSSVDGHADAITSAKKKIAGVKLNVLNEAAVALTRMPGVTVEKIAKVKEAYPSANFYF